MQEDQHVQPRESFNQISNSATEKGEGVLNNLGLGRFLEGDDLPENWSAGIVLCDYITRTSHFLGTERRKRMDDHDRLDGGISAQRCCHYGPKCNEAELTLPPTDRNKEIYIVKLYAI